MKSKRVKKVTDGVKVSAGAELYSFLYKLLERRDLLARAAKEFSDIDFTLKTYFEGVPDFVIGPYRVQGQWHTKTVFDVPQNVEKKYTRTQRFWRTSIQKLKGGKTCNI